MSRLSLNPDKDLPNLSGKVVLITGGTAGLGKETVTHLAKHGASRIYISGRNASRVNSVTKQAHDAGSTTEVAFVQCDLGSLDSVKAMAERITAQESRLDILICNAGIMATPPGLTSDGYEMQFGINHLAHAVLIQKMLPLLQQSVDPRIVLVSSMAFQLHPKEGIVFKALKTPQDLGAFGSWIRYGQSKLANVLYAQELARQYPDITAVSIHPGVIKTGLVKSLRPGHRAFAYITNIGRFRSPSEGAYNQVWAATVAKDRLKNGQFYEPVGILSSKLDKTARDERLASRLWEWTAEQIESNRKM